MKNLKIWEENKYYPGVYTRKTVELSDLEEIALVSGVSTEKRITVFKNHGWTIIDGNDYRLPDRKKYADYYVVKLRQTNSTTHGKCIATTFAIKRPEGQEAGR